MSKSEAPEPFISFTLRLTNQLRRPFINGWQTPEYANLPSGARPTASPVVRAATADDTADILNLLATSYEHERAPRMLEYWKWKHEQNPFGASPCLVATSEGRIVGVRVFLRWVWCSGNQHVRAVRAVDTATLPEWRGQGVFSRLTMRLVEQMQTDGIRFIYNTPNSKSMPGYLKMGWEPVTRIPLWVRPVRLSDVARRAFSNIPAQAPTLNHVDTVTDLLDGRWLPEFLRDATIDDERYHTPRTPDYFRWRYAHIPGIAYSARFDFSGDAGAFLVARGRVRGHLREVTISELVVTPSMRGVQIARDLLADLVRSADTDYVAACAAKGTAERQALARAGFLPAPRLGPHFTIRRLDSTGPDPARWQHWRCSIGDLEVF